MEASPNRRVKTPMESPTKLTQFAPLSSETRQPMGGFSFARLFKRSIREPQDPSPKPTETHLPLDDEEVISKEEDVEEQIAGGSSFPKDFWVDGSKNVTNDERDSNRERERDIVYARSLTNVLRRISSIRDKRGSGMPQSYKDSDFKQYWMPDSNCKECYECGDKFTTFRRRHHCRVCGQIFCSRCCNQEIPGKIMGYTGDLRVCTHCCRIVLSYIQSSDVSADMRTFQEELHHKLSLLNPLVDGTQYASRRLSSLRRKNSVGFREEEFARNRSSSSSDVSSFPSSADFSALDQISTERRILAQDSTQLKELWQQIQDPVNGVSLQNHRHRLRTYPNCLVGSELVDWLLAQDKANNRAQATAIGQGLVDAKLLESVTNQEQLFVDEYALYRPGQLSQMENPDLFDTQSCEHHDSQEGQDPLWVKEISQEDSETTEGESDLAHSVEWSYDTQDKDITEIDSSPDISPCLHSSSSSFFIDMNIRENRVSISKPKVPEILHVPEIHECCKEGNQQEFTSSVEQGVQLMHQDISNTTISDEFLKGALLANSAQQNSTDFYAPLGWYSDQQLRSDNGEKIAFQRLEKAFTNHEQTLLRQLLSSEGLSLTWCDVILPIIHKVSEVVRPDVKNDDDMDIRQYIQFKKIPGGSKSECSIINGIVCTKNVAHKKMQTHIINPSILLLGSPIVYQRHENKLLSLDPLVMQEFDYLKNVVSKIASFQPDIVLVGKTVSRLAQDFLLEQGITLVLNVKPSVMDRVSRCTQASIVSSVDAQIARPQLGMCHSFKVQNHPLPNGRVKTLMYFDGCASHLGCTITLRGASNAELKKVKQIMQFMVYVAYNWRLERSFLMDEFAMPPQLPEEIPLLIENGDGSIKNKQLPINNFQSPRKNPTSEVSDNVVLTNVDLESGKLIAEHLENEKTVALDNNKINEEILKSSSVKAKPNESNNSVAVGSNSEIKVQNETSSPCEEMDSDIHTKKPESQCVEDFSDPLHLFLNSEDEPVLRQNGSQLQVATLPFGNSFRKALDDVILCCSPNIKFSLPYLETEMGRHCRLRQYFDDEIFWSSQFFKDRPSYRKSFSNMENTPSSSDDIYSSGFGVITDDIEILPFHPFMTHCFTSQIEDSKYQHLLADFRARGGRIRRLCPHEIKERDKERKNMQNKEVVESNSPHNAGLLWERKVDALDPFHHQRLVVLFCSYSSLSNNAPNFCVNPRVVAMGFYGSNDITLGDFLERYCFRPTYKCPSPLCNTPMTDHVRKFAHETGCVHIVLRKLENLIPICPGTIVTWSWCRKCNQVTPVVPMSLDSWSLSFAKYLELRFHGNQYSRRGTVETCQHTLHQDHYQYFGFKHMVASFKFSPILLREVALPPLIIAFKEPPTPSNTIIEEIKNLAIKMSTIFSTILEWLCTVKEEYAGTRYEQTILELTTCQQKEQAVFREKIEEIQLKLTSPTLENKMACEKSHIMQTDAKEACVIMWKISDCVVNLKRLIADTVITWNNRVQEFLQQRKKDEKMVKPSTKLLLPSSIINATTDVVSPRIIEEGTQALSITHNSTSHNVTKSLSESFKYKSSEEQSLSDVDIGKSGEDSEVFDGSAVSANLDENGDMNQSSELSSSTAEEEQYIDSTTDLKTGTKSYSAEPLRHSDSDPSFMMMSSPEVHTDSSNSSYIIIGKKHSFPDTSCIQPEQMDLNPECISSIDNFNNSEGINIKEEGRKLESRGHERSRSDGDGKLITERFRFSVPIRSVDEDHSEMGRNEKKPGSVKMMISQLLSSPNNDLLASPFALTEHHLLPLCEKIPVVVYEEEIGSIIAYALSSSEYEVQLKEIKQNMVSSQKESLNCSPILKRKNIKSTEKDPNPTSNTNEIQINVENSVEDKDFQFYPPAESDKAKGNAKLQPNAHIEVQFSDATAKFYCRIYFAEQFRKLRKLVFPDGEECFIRSLTRCINWQAKGGKSGLTFCKTNDDRFILKQMSRLEIQSFLDFAPHYFQYISTAFTEQKPTVLAKIIGVFRIGYRNNQNNAASKMDVLVIENLFYDRYITQKFDLKGSIRNRLVNTSGKQEGELVLLDENLLKMTCDNPLYIRPHSKTVLTLAINNDTQFLSSQLVMDYSLLVGIDENDSELVVGIIDYIRTFTWDKKIEMVVKSRGFLGGQGKMPTVVSPELYRKRFCEAMDRYFLHVPDRWSGLGKGVDS